MLAYCLIKFIILCFDIKCFFFFHGSANCCVHVHTAASISWCRIFSSTSFCDRCYYPSGRPNDLCMDTAVNGSEQFFLTFNPLEYDHSPASSPLVKLSEWCTAALFSDGKIRGREVKWYWNCNFYSMYKWLMGIHNHLCANSLKRK